MYAWSENNDIVVKYANLAKESEFELKITSRCAYTLCTWLYVHRSSCQNTGYLSFGNYLKNIPTFTPFEQFMKQSQEKWINGKCKVLFQNQPWIFKGTCISRGYFQTEPMWTFFKFMKKAYLQLSWIAWNNSESRKINDPVSLAKTNYTKITGFTIIHPTCI